MNPAQQQALIQLDRNRESYFKEFPNRWIAVNANGTVRSAAQFDLLTQAPGLDAESFVFAFVADGAWA